MWWQRVLKRLLVALGGVATVAVLLFMLWWGPWLFTLHPSSELTDAEELKAQNDVRTTLVQTVAGLAVAAGAFVTYRTFTHNQRDQANRRDREERTYKLDQSQQITDTYTKAVEQLGHEQAPVRLGALYSLVNLAQDNPPRRQTVVDVLCAYLRMPYTPSEWEGAVTGSAPTAAEDASPGNRAQEKRERDAAQELQVRQTAQRLLADHLRRPLGTSGEDAQSTEASPEETFWPGVTLDLTGAFLFGHSMTGTSVVSAAFDEATFTGRASFDWVTFTGPATFDGATFTSEAWFHNAAFSGHASFGGATFSGHASFGGATFSGDASFGAATFSGGAGFGGATFTGRAPFDQANFSGGAGFDRATFSGDASFGEATFSGDASFDVATFSGPALFEDATFTSDVRFRWASFTSLAWFRGATFSRGAAFDKASFSGDAAFDGATFSGDASFDEATFSGHVSFNQAHVLRINDPELDTGGENLLGTWPEGWTVRSDEEDPTRDTLAFRVGGDSNP